LENPDEELDLDYVQGHGVDMEFEYAMSNSLAFGGHNASLLIKKYEA
jgi:3-oxoacyl-[acyl-carrier-protein] synthase II